MTSKVMARIGRGLNQTFTGAPAGRL